MLDSDALKANWVAAIGSLLLMGAALGATMLLLRRFHAARQAARLLAQEQAILGHSERRFRALVQRTSELVAILDRDGRIRYQSPAVEALLGVPEAVIGESLLALVHPEDAAAVEQALIDVAREPGGSGSIEVRVRHTDGSWRDIEGTCLNLLHDPDIGGLVMNARDVTERKALSEQLAYRASHDPLTNLPNREMLRNDLYQALAQAEHDKTPLALLLLDLDRFKEVNDTLGHAYGDILLQQIGPRLQTLLDVQQTFGRLGGDEFAIILPGCDALEASRIATQLRSALARPITIDGINLDVSGSIGIALFPDHARDADTLLRLADVAMYAAKRSDMGVVVYHSESDHHTPERLALVGELRDAIDSDELIVHYQPKLDLRDGTPVGLEALVRWNHRRRGLIPPQEFIPLAEQTGLIGPLTRRVLESVLRQQHAWRAAGLETPVAVNLSRRMLHDAELPRMVADLLSQSEVPPSALDLEVTESSLMADPARSCANLAQLRALGIRIAIDDFGTGYSSLAFLKSLPIDELKIDKSFVRDMAVDHGARGIVRAIIDLADDLGMRAVAEGVEDRATWDVLASLGCQVAQGYYISRPVPADELTQWWTRLAVHTDVCSRQAQLEERLQERVRERGARLTAEDEFIARKRVEAALVESEERLRLTLDAARMGTWDTDLRSGETAVSDLAARLLGQDSGGLLPRRRFYAHVHPEDRAEVRQKATAAIVERTPYEVEFRVIWPNGCVRWLECKGHALYDRAGQPERMIGTVRDVTERKEATEALRRSQAQLAEAQQIAHVGSWELDLDSQRLTWSDEHYRIFGLEPTNETLPYLDGLSHIHPDDIGRVRAQFEEAIASGGSYTTDLRIVRPDGTMRVIRSQGAFVASDDASAGRMVGTAQDITERVEADRHQSQLAAHVQLLLASTSDGIYGIDTDGRCTFINQAGAALLGYAPDELIGQHMHTSVHHHHPDGAPFRVEDCPIYQAMRSGAPCRLDTDVLWRRDGIPLTAEFVANPLIESGRVVGVVVAFHDVSERKRAEAALRESEARYRRLMEEAGDGIIVIGDGGRVMEANPSAEQVLGYGPGCLLGKRLHDLIAPDDLAANPLRIQPGDGRLRIERRMLRQNGQEVHVEVNATALPDGRRFGIFRDITERKRAERQREAIVQGEKLRALGQMASGIAHDLNQSLMLVASYGDLALQALQQDAPDLDELRDLLTTATQAALDGGDTVKRLLLFTSPRLDQDRQLVDMSTIVRDAVRLTAPRWRDAPQAEGRPISLHVDTEGQATVDVSAARMHEVMTNLIFNAVDALPSGGSIRIRVAAEADQCVVEVADSGVGMTPEVQAHIFEPFYTTRGNAGTGLGLALVFGIVEQHGGQISVQSQPGHGTIMRMTLPCVVSAAPTATRAPAAPHDGQRRLRVLAVDDEPAITKAVMRMLRSSGHDVIIATSGEEAVEKLTQQDVDVVVSDLGMGEGMNGWELASTVRHRWPEVRFILATGWGAAIDPGEARAKGVQAVLAKPYRPIDLASALSVAEAA